jgi:hypothetical protein
MKRILTRMAALSLLVIATFWFGIDTEAGRLGCGEQMFAAQSACDSSLSGTIDSYRNVTYYSPNQCDNQAQNQCFNSQDPNCYTNVYNNCISTTVSTYNNRYTSYGDCITATNNTTCYDQVDFCSLARDRANQCEALLDSEDMIGAYMSCRNGSGIDRCQ